MTFNEWFCSLPAARQAALREDKWLLAHVAFDAGKVQQLELQAERDRLLDSLARAGLEASRMVRQERCEIAKWLEAQGEPGYAHGVRNRRF